jgi:C-terminal processing protease CtpA/Prc
MSKPRFSLRGLDSVPPHANAEVHERIMAKLKRMTPHEIFLTLVDAGIYTPEGKLTERYGGEPDTPAEATQKKSTRAPQRTSAKTAQRKSTGASRRKSVKDSRH